MPSQSPSPLSARGVTALTGLFLAFWTLFFLITTWHWPLVGDASLIDYAVFLTQHGFAPYRDISDINMPGAYLTDWLALHLFGAGALGLRIFDLVLIAAAGLAMQSIAGKGQRILGWMAAAILLLLHGRDGVAQAGQRDLVMAVLLLGAYACLYRVVRRESASGLASNPLWLGAAAFLASFLASWSATIKPTVVPFLPVLAIFAGFLLRRSPHRLRLAAFGLAGFALPFLIVLMYLWRWHSLGALYLTLTGVVRMHAGLDHRPLGYLLVHSLSPIPAIAVLWLAITWLQNWKQWERVGFALALAFGLFTYIVQAKGYQYHRYPLLAFLLLIMAIDFARTLRSSGWPKWIAALAIALLLLDVVPVSAIESSRYDWRNQEFITLLESDLHGLASNSGSSSSGSGLSGQVQCLDTTAGCINTLYRMRLVQSTGLLYDCYLMLPNQIPATLALRAKYLALWEQHPPRVFIVSNQLCLDRPPSFDKLHNWPAFDHFLAQNYALQAERTPPHRVKWWSRWQDPASYRLYVRNHTESVYP
jgi:hypothetical protein